MVIYALGIFVTFAVVGGLAVFLLIRADASRGPDDDTPERGQPRR